MRSIPSKLLFALLAAALVVAGLVAIGWKHHHDRYRTRRHAEAITGGDSRRGEAMFIQYGCGSCHALEDVRNATGNVSPPLDGIATRMIIAGHLANKPDNMQKWIRDPQHVSPGTAMPDLGVGERDARDITAFLYTRTN